MISIERRIGSNRNCDCDRDPTVIVNDLTVIRRQDPSLMRMPIVITNQGHRDPAVFQWIVLQLSDPFGLTSSWLKVSGWAGAAEHSTNFSWK